ncbi:MAG: hypothetical protein OEY39_06060, partial [Candidatus Bathyarchaeota archaeon]|nr:hypothetical protein [Candidatus Bathyarchaeota archaeon]
GGASNDVLDLNNRLSQRHKKHSSKLMASCFKYVLTEKFRRHQLSASPADLQLAFASKRYNTRAYCLMGKPHIWSAGKHKRLEKSQFVEDFGD